MSAPYFIYSLLHKGRLSTFSSISGLIKNKGPELSEDPETLKIAIYNKLSRGEVLFSGEGFSIYKTPLLKNRKNK
jgi:hypothetical protein